MCHSLQLNFNQKLHFNGNEIFYDPSKCLGMFLSIYQMGKAQLCVLDERFIVTTCRQEQLNTDHLR